jgi:hypothetical protein
MKMAVHCVNDALCFVSSSLLANGFSLRNRQLLVTEKRFRFCCTEEIQHLTARIYLTLALCPTI